MRSEFHDKGWTVIVFNHAAHAGFRQEPAGLIDYPLAEQFA
jgi:hypothetical protein